MVKKPPDCNSCWEREAQMGHSRRLWFEEKFGKYITKPTTDLIVEQPQIIQADINLSNVCNLKCPCVVAGQAIVGSIEEVTLAEKDRRYQKNPKMQSVRNVTVEEISIYCLI